MKHTLIMATILSAVFSLTSCNSNEEPKSVAANDTAAGHATEHATTPSHDSNNEVMAAMNSSMEKMKNMKMSGDFDHDFAKMMIDHHQGAIDMAQVQISKGTDASLKQMAQKMIFAQKKEIDQFNKILSGYKSRSKDSSGAAEHTDDHNELLEAMNEMMNKMKGMTMSGNTDKDFAMMMIPHHESAVKMAENEITHGKNLELKKMAQKIVDDQAREIKELQAWIDKNK